MAGPWEDYAPKAAAPAQGPWADYQPKPAAKAPAKPAPKPKAPPVAQWVNDHIANDQGPIGNAYRYMRAHNDANLAQHDQNARTPAPGASSPLDYIGQELKGAIGGAFDKLRGDVSADYNKFKARAQMSPGAAAADSLKGYGRTAGIVKDVGGLLLSPIGAVAHGAVIRPAATVAASTIPGANYRDSEQVIGNALQAVGPRGRMAGGGAGYAARTAAQARSVAAKAVTKPNALQESVARFDQAGVPPSLAASKPALAPLAKVPASNAFAGARTRGFIRGQVDAVQNKAGQIAGQYGNGGTRQAAGQTLQRGVDTFANGKDGVTFKTRAEGLYDKAFSDLDGALVGKQDPVRTVPKPETYYTQKRVQVGGSQVKAPAAKAVLNNITNSVQSKPIADIVADPTLKRVATALRTGEQDMTFSDLRRLRTWVRTAQKDTNLRQQIGDANLNRLESGLTADIYANAQTLGSPRLLHQLKRADDYYRAGMERINGKLNAVFKAKSEEGAYDMIHKAAQDGGGADLARLTAVKRSLGPDWGDVAATVAKRLGKPTAGAVRGAAEGETPFSISTFVKNYADLSDAGKETLFGARGGGGTKATQLKAALDNLASVAGDLKSVESAANHSNTANHAQTLVTIAGVAHPATTLPTLTGLGAEALTGEIMTNPAVVRWIARAAKAKTPAQAVSTRNQLQQLIKTNPALAGQLKTLGQTLNVAAPAAGYTSSASQ